MILHTGNQCLGRYLQEAFVEAAADGDRPFHQCIHLIKQSRVNVCMAAQCGAGLADLCLNRCAPLCHIGNHLAGLLQCFRVGFRVANSDVVRMVKAVSTAVAIAVDAENAGLYRRVAEQQHNPVNRAYKFDIRTAPAHALRHGQRFQGLLQ